LLVEYKSWLVNIAEAKLKAFETFTTFGMALVWALTYPGAS
jgi:hypothetical protein